MPGTAEHLELLAFGTEREHDDGVGARLLDAQDVGKRSFANHPPSPHPSSFLVGVGKREAHRTETGCDVVGNAVGEATLGVGHGLRLRLRTSHRPVSSWSAPLRGHGCQDRDDERAARADGSSSNRLGHGSTWERQEHPGAELARSLRIPFVARDDVRGGLFFTDGAWTPTPRRVPTSDEAVEALLQIVETTAGLGVSCVVEYVVRRGRPQDWARITAAADCVVLMTTCRDATSRFPHRAMNDALLNRRAVLDAPVVMRST